jgi:hypothetical protein
MAQDYLEGAIRYRVADRALPLNPLRRLDFGQKKAAHEARLSQ